MKIYHVYGTYSLRGDEVLLGTFSTKEKAEECKLQIEQNDAWHPKCWIEEAELDCEL